MAVVALDKQALGCGSPYDWLLMYSTDLATFVVFGAQLSSISVHLEVKLQHMVLAHHYCGSHKTSIESLVVYW